MIPTSLVVVYIVAALVSCLSFSYLGKELYLARGRDIMLKHLVLVLIASFIPMLNVTTAIVSFAMVMSETDLLACTIIKSRRFDQ